LPRRLPLELFDFESAPGPYTGDEGAHYDSVETVVCLNNQFTDMVELIKTSFFFSADKKEQFR